MGQKQNHFSVYKTEIEPSKLKDYFQFCFDAMSFRGTRNHTSNSGPIGCDFSCLEMTGPQKYQG
jgi:hypothetical protein